jgi:hypothetical protein
MLTKEGFTFHMEKIKDYLDDVDRIQKAISSVSFNEFTLNLGYDMLDGYIEALMLLMEDQNEWIPWFVFENDFGKNKLVLPLQGKGVALKNHNQLYELIKKENKERSSK